MNMTLSKRGDYVMRSAIALARAFESGSPRKIREVVADTEVPRTFASQILADLVRAGLAVSRAGRDGGYWLARPPSEISVLEVVEAAEGPLRAERCALGDGPCRWADVCPLHETWSAATAQLSELLANTSLAEVAARDSAIEAGRYDAPADAHRSHPVTVQVDDAVQVELAAQAIGPALARQVGQLANLVSAAALDLLPGTDSSAVRRQPPLGAVAAECSLDPVERARKGDPARYLLAWRISGTESAGYFEGELSVAAVDPERAELQVAGTWHHDAAVAPSLEEAELERRARRLLRGFLRRLARAVEEASEPARAVSGRGRSPAGAGARRPH